MKILLPVDGSPCSEAAVAEIARRPWPDGSTIRVLFVIHATAPLLPDPFLHGLAGYYESVADERKLAGPILERAVDVLRSGEGTAALAVETSSVEGSPKTEILDEAERWGADLVALGAHGRSAAQRHFFGSVAHAVVQHAHCSVEIVRCREHAHASRSDR